jgi:hypothetical protein
MAKDKSATDAELVTRPPKDEPTDESVLRRGRLVLRQFWAISNGGDVAHDELVEGLSQLQATKQELLRMTAALPNQPEGTTTGNAIARARDVLDALASDA